MEEWLKRHCTIALCLFALLAVDSGCQPKRPTAAVPPPARIDYSAPLPEGEMALKQIGAAEYPDFSAGLANGDLDGLKRSVDNSLKYIARPGSAKAYPYLTITHDRAAATLRAFRQLLDQQNGAMTSQELNRLIAERFDVYASVGAPSPDGRGYTGQ